MNIWVEWHKYEDKSNNTHAQMKEQVHWVEPDPKTIFRRFFPDKISAMEYATQMNDQGYHAVIKQDGYSY